ncbi:hypothetical protein PMAYCL1PPCAC_29821 [Pristionchus mayeri]|uniref:Uncharacterized protein n=1 Tax=Pristionchus mayeri TaxID=1317129 RepID=A0AAN5IEJ2_9BILA|nr:hypothetical protein PMAYCL1PPCAC_29821 [Pristionchus mayeri]
MKKTAILTCKHVHRQQHSKEPRIAAFQKIDYFWNEYSLICSTTILQTTSILFSPPLSCNRSSSNTPASHNYACSKSPSPVIDDTDSGGVLPSTVPISLPTPVNQSLPPIEKEGGNETAPPLAILSPSAPSPTAVHERYRRTFRRNSLSVPLIEADRDENGLYVCPVCRCVKFETDGVKWTRGIQKNNVTGHMKMHTAKGKKIAHSMLTMKRVDGER